MTDRLNRIESSYHSVVWIRLMLRLESKKPGGARQARRRICCEMTLSCERTRSVYLWVFTFYRFVRVVVHNKTKCWMDYGHLFACSDTHTLDRGIINVKGIRSLRRCCKILTKKKRKEKQPVTWTGRINNSSFCVAVYVLVFVSSVCYVGVSDNISEREALQVY